LSSARCPASGEKGRREKGDDKRGRAVSERERRGRERRPAGPFRLAGRAALGWRGSEGKEGGKAGPAGALGRGVAPGRGKKEKGEGNWAARGSGPKERKRGEKGKRKFSWIVWNFDKF